MGTVSNGYETAASFTEKGVQYIFISIGERSIIKVIQYFFVHNYLGKKVYNLGFGDYNPQTNKISDGNVSNNGDQYRVFHSVLNTIPDFFAAFPTAMIMVEGSDSSQAFKEDCRLTCIKRCGESECSNADRRITLYRNYVEKYYEVLIQQYFFYGIRLRFDNQHIVEKYRRGRNIVEF